VSGAHPCGIGLSSLRDEAAKASSPKASIPCAEFDSIAAEFQPYIAVLVDNKQFTGARLRRAWEDSAGDARSAAVMAVDGFHGFTCEFSPWPRQHVSEYDQLEEMLEAAASAIEARSDETRSGSAEGESATSEAGDAQ